MTVKCTVLAFQLHVMRMRCLVLGVLSPVVSLDPKTVYKNRDEKERRLDGHIAEVKLFVVANAIFVTRFGGWP